MTLDLDSLVNRIQAKGEYDNQWVSAENFSALQLNWLSCCPPQLFAAKQASIDAKDSMLVRYKIVLKNREKSSMAASITDRLPDGMEFINSSLEPADHGPDWVTWNLIDLKPGEAVIIDYLVKALRTGTFVNQAHIDAHYLNGSDSASADVSSSIDIGGSKYSRSSSDWQPPSCFGLNCTQQAFGDDWAACYTCGASEPPPLASICSSCTSAANSDVGYDIP
ncbi:Uncharacterised protein [uncultured archaeon]|nr:Uncharacterised protein [uncultured archaeon]